ncbi:hypothetical protein F5Y14DRAFT_95204 [Nemania sp. NC0429]|nr:hypothetical protein F5Y14DRAFT_95204 [Nemania sp. NC0429]
MLPRPLHQANTVRFTDRLSLQYLSLTFFFFFFFFFSIHPPPLSSLRSCCRKRASPASHRIISYRLVRVMSCRAMLGMCVCYAARYAYVMLCHAMLCCVPYLLAHDLALCLEFTYFWLSEVFTRRQLRDCVCPFSLLDPCLAPPAPPS